MKNTRRRTRRKHGSKRAVQALAAGAMIAAGTQAYAEPIRFDNPPGAEHFDWAAGADVDYVFLDMLLPASGQPAVEGSSTLGQRRPGANSLLSGAVWTEVGGPYDFFAIGLDAGELIPSGSPFGGTAQIYYPGFGSQLPEGTATYLGNRFDIGAGWQYGWIGVVRTGLELDAFAWGYETEAGVPIPAGIPEPGTLAALALGAAALLRRRRCRSQID